MRGSGEAIVVIDDATGRVVASAPAASTTGVVVRGASGAHDDTLTVELSDALRLPGGIDYDGGSGGWDTLILAGHAPGDHVVTHLSSSDGILDLGGLSVRYFNLEPVTDTIGSANYVITATAGGEEINVVDGPIVGTTQTTQVNSGLSGTFESIDFANKTNVTVNSGGGADLFTVNIPNPAAGLATLTLNGSADANTFTITPSATVPITVTGGAPLPPGTGDRLIVPLAGATGTSLSIASDANGLQGAFTFGNRQSVTFSQVETINPANLFLTKNGPATITAGDTATYTVSVQNLGPNDAANVVISDTLPASTTFVSLTPSAGLSCTTPAVGATGTVTCSSAVLLNGATATFSLVVRLSSGTAAGTIVNNTASVTSGTSELNPADNSATRPSTVATVTDLSVTKTGPATVPPSAPLSYTIVVANNGPSDASTVTLADTLPAGMTFASLTQTAGPLFSCTTPAVGGTGAVTCTLATLTSAATASFTLVVNAPSTAGPVTNTATVTSSTTDTIIGNNTAVETVTVTLPAAVAAIPTASEWALFLLAGMLGLLAVMKLR